MASSSTIVISELTGPTGRVLTLVGAALPFTGEWGREMRMATSWATGSPEGTQQLFGPTLVPAEWEGVWRRTLLSRTPAKYAENGTGDVSLVNPDALWIAFERIVAAGQRLRVIWETTRPWDGSTFQVVREGRLKAFRAKPERAIGDVGWNASFEWVSDGGAAAKIDSGANAELYDGGADVLEARMNKLRDDYLKARDAQTAAVAAGATAFTLGKVERLAEEPDRLVKGALQSLGQVTSAVRSATNVALTVQRTPARIANRVVAFARNAVAIVHQYQDAQSRVSAELQTTSENAVDVMNAVARFSTAFRNAQDYARSAQQTASKLAAQQTAPKAATSPSIRDVAARAAAASPPADVLAFHRVKSGDSPVSIARRYYGTPDLAGALMRANHLPPHQVTLDPGALVVVPTRAAIDGASS